MTSSFEGSITVPTKWQKLAGLWQSPLEGYSCSESTSNICYYFSDSQCSQVEKSMDGNKSDAAYHYAS